jgi:pyruvate kinase
LTGEDVAGDETKVSVYVSDFYKEVQKGSVILIDDGLIRLTVQKVVGKEIHCMVENGGELKKQQEQQHSRVDLPLPSLNGKGYL